MSFIIRKYVKSVIVFLALNQRREYAMVKMKKGGRKKYWKRSSAFN